jgi:DNA gyrase/topoisomerase IV subunit B
VLLIQKKPKMNNVIERLTEIEHVRQKPGMYVGSTARETHIRWTMGSTGFVEKPVDFSPAIIKMFDEIVSNSIDESFRLNHKSPTGHQFEINIIVGTLLGSSVLVISDNGRGIPQSVMSDDPTMTQAEAAVTCLRTGSNFKEKTYASIGTHGLGAALVNILSSNFELETRDGTNLFTLSCSRGVTAYKKQEREKSTTGTKISFIPDWPLFEGVTKFDPEHEDLILKRVIDLSVALPKIKFTFNRKLVPVRDFISYARAHSPEGVVEVHVSPKTETRVAVFSAAEPKQVSFVNGIDTYEGGGHVDWIREQVVQQLVIRIKKQHKLEIKPKDARNRLGFVVMLNGVTDAKFRSQSKEYLTNSASSLASFFGGIDPEKIAKSISNTPALVDPIIEAYRLKEDAKDRALVDAAKKKRSKKTVPAHLPANSRDRSKTTLFLTEGDSAIGALSTVRNPDIHGGYPLRGKCRNVHGLKWSEIVSNVEISALMDIIGLQPGEPADLAALNYGRIALMADADHDGSSIVGLLINIFSLWPNLIESGRVVIWKSPIVKWEKGKNKGIFYTMEEYTSSKTIPNGAEITYLKGLGSLTESEYRMMINEPIVQVVKQDGPWKNSLELVFGDDEDLRKDWLSDPSNLFVEARK